MAILVRGRTRCNGCNEPIRAGESAVLFPSFLVNERDPSYRFNDAAYHQHCLDVDPDAASARARCEEMLSKLQPSLRRCIACSGVLQAPDDIFVGPHLSHDPGDELSAYNYVVLHGTCLGRWPDLDRYASLTARLFSSPAWDGPTFAFHRFSNGRVRVVRGG